MSAPIRKEELSFEDLPRAELTWFIAVDPTRHFICYLRRSPLDPLRDAKILLGTFEWGVKIRSVVIW